ncbi:MAG: hypothetical protein HYS87_01825 [Candidatus Colwellbacteria bacterium]|nr:hypothetical protein [Candidatus Colwellbacteria bacterium]
MKFIKLTILNLVIIGLFGVISFVYAENLEEDIAERTAKVETALYFSIEEANTLQKEFKAVPLSEDKRELQKYAQLEALLNSDIEWYFNKLGSLQTTEFKDAEEVRAFALQIIEYREKIYIETDIEVSNFVSFIYSGDVITKASETLSKLIEEDATGVYKTELDKTAALIKEAGELRAGAEANILPPLESIEPIEEVTIEVESDQPPTTKELLDKALANIKTAYEIILELAI